MNLPVSKIRRASLDLYRRTGKIHARSVDGRFNRWRWGMVWLTQMIFYGLAWLNWSVPAGDRQAVLFDIAAQRLYLFDLVLWPQDALLLALALIIGATALFFVTALAGRLFCGFACPQTVYTMIFTWIEARVEGDHLARLRLDQGGWSPRKIGLKGLKHLLWLALSVWTAITFVGYFTPLRQLLPDLLALDIGPWCAFWLIVYAIFTYVQAGLAREAVCQHMCPYSRFQGVMFDPLTRNVAYDRQRGEPRRAKGRAQAEGDCIDCGLCVQVCPTGIDIRDGLQYPCINCGLCIDACDSVMDQTGGARGLIRFASAHELQGEKPANCFCNRPRVLVYLALLLILLGVTVWIVVQRPLLRVDVLRDRGALSRIAEDGRIENAYMLKVANLDQRPHDYRILVEGVPEIEVIGDSLVRVDAGSVRTIPLAVSAPDGARAPGMVPIQFLLSSEARPAELVREKSSFAFP